MPQKKEYMFFCFAKKNTLGIVKTQEILTDMYGLSDQSDEKANQCVRSGCGHIHPHFLKNRSVIFFGQRAEWQLEPRQSSGERGQEWPRQQE